MQEVWQTHDFGLKANFSSPLFIWPVTGFIKYVVWSIDERRLTELYAEMGKVVKKEVPLPRADRHRIKPINPKIQAKENASNN